MAEQQNTPEFINDPTGHDEDAEDAVPLGSPKVNSIFDPLEHNSVPAEKDNSVPAVELNGLPNSDNLEFSKELLKRRAGAEYDMRHEGRGPALIFNQNKFKERNDPLETPTERTSSHLDVAALAKQLKRLDFAVQLHVDYTKAEILDKTQKLAEEDHTQNDCILIAIFTHGETDGIIYAHDKKVRLNTILAKFTDENCPSLKGKPKLFFLQCCQGSGEDLGGKIKRPSTPAEEEEEEEDEDEAVSFELSQNPDFLIAHPSAHGLKSWRRRDYGSWFIQKLCEQLEKNGTNLDLMGILTYASHHIAKLETTGGAKQVPCITSTLTRVVLFDDKKHQPGTNH